MSTFRVELFSLEIIPQLLISGFKPLVFCNLHFKIITDYHPDGEHALQKEREDRSKQAPDLYEWFTQHPVGGEPRVS